MKIVQGVLMKALFLLAKSFETMLIEMLKGSKEKNIQQDIGAKIYACRKLWCFERENS